MAGFLNQGDYGDYLNTSERSTGMVYAPIRIVTLNRYEHFKRCLESLEANLLAGNTEVYVSVDYPAKEFHWDGYKKIVRYLEKKKDCNAFAKLHVYIQEKNLGSGANFQFLEDIIFEKHERMISLEDDIETSVNFLEYMDKSLEWGARNKKIFCVCGYFHTNSNIMKSAVEHNNCMIKSTFNPWGVGHYKEEYQKMKNTISVEWMDNLASNGKLMLHLFIYRKYIFFMYVIEYLVNRSQVFFNTDGSLRNIDIVTNLYMELNKKAAIFPTVSKTRNWGFDGSGMNCKENISADYNKRQLDLNDTFNFRDNDPIMISKKFMRRASREVKENKRDIYIAVVYYFLYRLGILKIIRGRRRK